MKPWKKHILVLSATLVTALLAAGCEDYGTWEARMQEEQQNTAVTTEALTDTYEGPNLADYVNAGIEEAKANGLYTESSGSALTDPSKTDDPTGSSGLDSSGQTNFADDQADTSNPDNVGQNRTDSDNVEQTGSTAGEAGLSGFGQNPDNSGQAGSSGQNLEDTLLSLSALEYAEEPFSEINGGIPFFTDEELAITEAFESYSELDELGRVGQAFACIDQSRMPQDGEERGNISAIRPTGWVQAKYEGIGNGDWLYNRCHLIAWALSAENDNPYNLMTGTRYFNVEGMLPYETETLQYLDAHPGNHVLYRATPVYAGNGLLAKGLLLEAYSVEDDGELSFCTYIHNVQPGVKLDYQTGESRIESED